MQLNKEQEEAVTTIEGPLLVLAGAGSGKTRVVTQRIIKLLGLGVPSDAILGVTFTNKAAGEMQERVRSATDQGVLISTFHSLGSKILRESIHELGYTQRFTIYDEEDSLKLIKACLEEQNINGKHLGPKVFKQLIAHAKNNLENPDEVKPDDSSEADSLFPGVYRQYQESLKHYQAVDFDDLLYLVVVLFNEHPQVLKEYQQRWQFLLIDEYQDTNKAQYEMMKLLAGETCNLCAVGDPDQSIYSWRGANIGNILNFEKDYPGGKVIRLERNYRSTTNILEAANAVIAHNYSRYEKKLWSELGEGEKIRFFRAPNDKGEAQFVAEKIRYYRDSEGLSLRDMVIFYRTNFQSRIFEDYLIDHGVPYVIVGGISFYQRREIKDVLAYLKLIQSSSDYIAFGRTVNLPKRGIGAASIEKIRLAAIQEGVPILDFCRSLIEEGRKGVRVTAKQKEGLRQYLGVIESLREEMESKSLHEVIQAAIRKSGYLDVLKSDPETADDRSGNLDELVAKAMEWENEREEVSLEAFLEEMALKSNLDEASADKDKLNLMTIHNGKGLEFDLVFVVGMEEDLFPHANSRGSQDALEEERRLFYVGMTRARKYLYLTAAGLRFLWGTERFQRPSRFISEIPTQYIQHVGGARATPRKQEPKEWIEEDDFIDEIDQTSQEILEEGDRVMHHDFGIGVIEEVYEGSMGVMLKVHFVRDQSTKSLVGRFAKLSKL